MATSFPATDAQAANAVAGHPFNAANTYHTPMAGAPGSAAWFVEAEDEVRVTGTPCALDL
jgi:hypothetical protein